MTVKRTFSLPDEVSAQLDQAAGASVSAYVAQAVREKIERDNAAAQIRAAIGDPDPSAYASWLQQLTASLPGQAGEGPAIGESG